MTHYKPTLDEAQLLSQAQDLHAKGDLRKAEQIYKNVLETSPLCSNALHWLGVLHAQRGDGTGALALIEQAISINSENATFYSNLGNVLRMLGRPLEAINAYNKALDISPQFPEALSNRGNAFLDLRQPAEALASFDLAIQYRPAFPEALNNRGIALLELQRPEEALKNYFAAVSLAPKFAEAVFGCGSAYASLREPHAAVQKFSEALLLRPNYPDAVYNRAHSQLILGNFQSGFSDYEARFNATESSIHRPSCTYPDWRGESLLGKNILVWEEQGIGDILQFGRLLLRLAELGAEVTFLVRPNLHRLLNSWTHLIRLVSELPQNLHFDYQCALLSLPLHLGLSLDTIPTQPYIEADPTGVSFWKNALNSHGFKIGINWQGNPNGKVDIGRSIPLKFFRPLLEVSGVRLISLQRFFGIDQLSALPDGMQVELPTPQLDSGADALVDTAAMMKCLDLIVTSDTSIAHLAGALGRPVWVGLQYSPDWRWMLDRIDSPWYPTMRLFRQPRKGDWNSVFEAMRTELDNLIRRQRTIQNGFVSIPVSIGELIDKITILEIKSNNIKDPEKLKHVTAELIDLLVVKSSLKQKVADEEELALKRINEALWAVEDRIRFYERQRDFGDEFISLARSVYQLNDERSRIKLRINNATGSTVVEVKSYES